MTQKFGNKSSAKAPALVSGASDYRSALQSEAQYHQKIRKQTYLLSQKLVSLRNQALRRELTALNACEKATSLINAQPNYKVKHAIVLYNQLMELHLMAGKGQRTMELLVEMKKRGRHPNIKTYTTILNGFSYMHVDPKKSTALIGAIDALFHEFEQLRREALASINGQRKPLRDRDSRSSPRELSFVEDEDSIFAAEPSSIGEFARSRKRLIEEIRSDPNAIDPVLAAYMRLMIKIGEGDLAWNVIHRLSTQWDPSPDGYPKLTRQTVGMWMSSNIVSSVEKAEAKGNTVNLTEKQSQQVFLVWNRWKGTLISGAESALARYRGTSDAGERDRIVKDWQRTIPKARQLQDLTQMARVSGSTEMCDLALQLLADFSDLPMPSELAEKAAKARKSLPSQVFEPGNPFYMLASFSVAQRDLHAEEYFVNASWDIPNGTESQITQLDRPARVGADRERRIKDSDRAERSTRSTYLGSLLGELMHVVPHCTLPGAPQVFKEIMTASARQELATVDRGHSTSSVPSGAYHCSDRSARGRNALYSLAYWGRALDSADAWIGGSRQNPRIAIESIMEILSTMRKLYRHGLMPDLPDERNYHRAMLQISRQISSGRVGNRELLQQVEVAHWWLSDCIEACRASSSLSQSGEMRWVELNGSIFARTAMSCYKILVASELRLAHFSNRQRRYLAKQQRGAESGGREVLIAQGDAVIAEEALDVARRGGAKHFVIYALHTWHKMYSARPNSRVDPSSVNEGIPFPPAHKFSASGTQSNDPDAKGDNATDTASWVEMIMNFLGLLRVALDTSDQGADVLPARDVQWMKAVRKRCHHALAVVEPQANNESSTQGSERGPASRRPRSPDGTPSSPKWDDGRRLPKSSEKKDPKTSRGSEGNT